MLAMIEINLLPEIYRPRDKTNIPLMLTVAAGMLVVGVGVSRMYVEAAYPGLPFSWPDFARGGEGVFVLERDALKADEKWG